MEVHVVTLRDDDGQILEVVALGSADLAQRCVDEMNLVTEDHAGVQSGALSVIETGVRLDEFLAGFRADMRGETETEMIQRAVPLGYLLAEDGPVAIWLEEFAQETGRASNPDQARFGGD